MTITELALEPTTLAIEQVASIVSGLAVFQEAVAKYSSDQARESIYKSYFRPPDLRIPGPIAVIFELPGSTWDRRSDTTVLPKGEIFLHLWLPMNLPDDPEGEERRFNNFHGQIAKAIADYIGPGFRLIPTITDPPAHTHPKDQGATQPFWNVGYTIAWSAF